ncbi:hypothetical protein [Burkholderia cenocepacia]|uniref:hypothetical protein n=1 Tax=Burkholderia cenocepacia TaxID=95486 RepID=UPI0026546D66|nr:hypothetical protein [Burkholderia cenocepacia]MDN7452312.1 hypothetical protein [Burkholderia cenocepacia]
MNARRLTNDARRTQRGQATVELVAGMGMVFILLFVAMTMLGKLGDVRNKTLIGARYVAWERTVWADPHDAGQGSDLDWYKKYGAAATQTTKSDAELRREVLSRVVSERRTALRSGDGGVAVAFPSAWRDPSGAPLVATLQDVAVTTRGAEAPSLGMEAGDKPPTDDLMRIANRSMGVRVPGIAGDPRFELVARNYQVGGVSVSVDLGSRFMRRLWPGMQGLTFSDVNTLVSNTWAPDNRQGTTRAIGPGRVVPAATNPRILLSDLDRRNIVAAMGNLDANLGVKDLSKTLDNENMRAGRIDPDVVPEGVLK